MRIYDTETLESGPLSVGEIEPCLRPLKAYCRMQQRSDGDTARFRSQELEAVATSVFPESCHSRFTPAMLPRLHDLRERRRAIGDDNSHEPDAGADRGRLLLVNWSASLFDGACSAITRGFLDEDGMPGWDTWARIVSFDESRTTHGLLCWVPDILLGLLDDAMRIDPARCMTWLKPDRNGLVVLLGWGMPG